MRHQSHLPRKVIAVDLDEVLARTTLAIADFHNDTYGTTLTMDDFISYDYTKVWGGTREESIAKWRLFFDSPYFLKVEPVEGSLETLKLLKARRFSLVIVTARQQFVADLTKKFVDRHFPGIFESIYFANHFLTEQEKLTFVSKPKSVICRDVHAQLLIDDSLENALEVSKAGIPVLLFDLHGKYKWNQLEEGQQLPEKVTRVKSWKDIQAWFPRPRSPLSNQCLSRFDQVSESSSSESEEEEDEEDEMEEDEEQLLYGYSPHHHQRHHQQQHHLHNPMDSDSDSDEDDEAEMDEDEMNELAKREQDGEEEEEDHGRTLRRRKLMMMDFSSSSDDDEDIDLESGRHHHHGNVDSNEHDLDLESGHRARHISHADLERYRHQHETMYMEEPGTEMEMEAESTSYLQQEDDMERGFISTTTTTATTAMTATTITTQVSIANVESSTVVVDSQSSTISTLPPPPPAASSEAAMAVEGLTIKSPPSSKPESFAVAATSLTNQADSMEDVPLA
ncbi:hypothetical protein BGZ97_007811 [Linnemannia gamsii]|uniref:Uncharacterized protein n=1 Tax=Linnemannia gamsii TaxID=64522 RepID=A0A9P6RDZ8_9FUNG|nr:hypothetical protein BGZ97_007811 [Linnemannia gamsii]